MRVLICSLWLAIIASVGVCRAVADEPASGDVPTALQEYVSTPDKSYGYELKDTQELDGCTVYKMELTSQTWHGIVWRHALYAYVPEDTNHTSTALLFITGGKIGGQPSDEDMQTGCKLAKLSTMPVVFLHQVPNQPLLGDRVEDDLITESFLRYLESRDASWPLLFPMVKSATSAMTAVQQFAKEKHNISVDQFVVTGGSKRGWTTWLTAVADKRVAAIAPIVINTLNFGPQMKHQLDCWGEYSEQIADYTTKGLVDVMIKQPDVPLWRWVDPYTYRSKLSLPKLIINGTNDRYWTVDATNLYWDDLVGEKHLRYVPNAGHGLDDGREGALITLAAFAQYVAEGRSMPKLDWNYQDADGKLQLDITSTAKPKSVRIWTANSGTKDFRDAKWKSSEISTSDGGDGNGKGAKYSGVVEKPKTGYLAAFGEATFDNGSFEYNLSTGLRQQ
jgi:PhoPQ-activated pathogenicity-related protein